MSTPRNLCLHVPRANRTSGVIRSMMSFAIEISPKYALHEKAQLLETVGDYLFQCIRRNSVNGRKIVYTVCHFALSVGQLFRFTRISVDKKTFLLRNYLHASTLFSIRNTTFNVCYFHAQIEDVRRSIVRSGATLVSRSHLHEKLYFA